MTCEHILLVLWLLAASSMAASLDSFWPDSQDDVILRPRRSLPSDVSSQQGDVRSRSRRSLLEPELSSDESGQTVGGSRDKRYFCRVGQTYNPILDRCLNAYNRKFHGRGKRQFCRPNQAYNPVLDRCTFTYRRNY